MTPDKVEEIVESFKSKFVDPQYNINGKIAYYEWSDNDYADDAILWLTQTLTQYHQDLMSEVVEKERPVSETYLDIVAAFGTIPLDKEGVIEVLTADRETVTRSVLQEIMDDVSMLHKQKELDDNGFGTIRDLLHSKALDGVV